MYSESLPLTFEVTLRAATFEDFVREVVKLHTQIFSVAKLAETPVEGGKPALSIGRDDSASNTVRALDPPPSVQPAQTIVDTTTTTEPPKTEGAKRGRKSAAEKAAAAPPKDRIFAEETAPVTAGETALKQPDEPHYTDDMPTPDLFNRLRAHAKEYHDEHGADKLKAIYAAHGIEGISKIAENRELLLKALKHIDNLLGTDPETGVIPPAGTDDLL